ncbi:MAG: hypothetical protein D084_Lepto4C00287G0004 [Leptospirillum sp. Group IV 'UBA BS']|nr:MAG: hypothetical protein D084_Lepto4C00287G0004 [Leptospirillum sp. Group IV 'UBA BS']
MSFSEQGVRILLPIAPKLLGLPPEIVEVIPLLNELGVHVVALDSELDRVFLDRPVPDFVTLAGKGDIQKIVSSADLVIPILRRIE